MVYYFILLYIILYCHGRVIGFVRKSYILTRYWPNLDSRVIVFAEICRRHIPISMCIQWCALQPWVTYWMKRSMPDIWIHIYLYIYIYIYICTSYIPISIYPYILASTTHTHPTPCPGGARGGGGSAYLRQGYMDICMYDIQIVL